MSGRDRRVNRNHYKKVDFAGKQTISADQFREVMNALLEEYGDAVIDVAVEAADKVSDEARLDLKGGSKSGGFKDITGLYRRGWRTRLEVKNIEVQAVTYNASGWQYTHLLEFGHQTRNGGRSQKFPHIADVNEWAVNEFAREIQQGVESL